MTTTKVKATLFNLLTYATHERAREDDFEALFSIILRKFPVHLISILERPGKPQLDEFPDRLSIELDRKDLFLAPYYILPNLVSDLPIYLFWGEDPIEEKTLLPLIAKWSKRLIFDCNPTANLSIWANKLSELIKSLPIDIVDVNWARTSGWRAALAQICDCEAILNSLKSCTSFQITFSKVTESKKQHPEIQALYVQAWLASSLGWKFQSCSRDNDLVRISYENQNGSFDVVLKPQEKKGIPSEEILEIELTCPNEIAFLLSYKEDSQVVVYASTNELCHLPYTVPLISMKKEQQFIHELFYKPNTAHYSRTLQWLINYGYY